MDLRQLRYFTAIAECGSISVAARGLRIAQPALTRQIHLLEAELETLLFERVPRGVQLTDAGKQLALDAGKLLDDALAAKDRARRAGQGKLGNLSLALPTRQFLPTAAAAFIQRFRDKTPGVMLTLSHLVSDVQLDLLGKGDLDAGVLLFRPVCDDSYQGIPIFSEKTLVAYPSHWRWENGAPQRLADLNETDFIWINRSAAPAWHDSMIHCFFKAGFVPRTAALGADAGSMLTLVTAGMGCTIVSETARHLANGSVSFLQLPDLDVIHHYELVWRSDNPSTALRRLINTLIDQNNESDEQRF